MADSKITALTSISTSTDPANDPLVIVDVSDTSMAASGTAKKVTLNQLLGASGTATLASATITGDLTVDTSTLKVVSASDVVGINTTSPLTGNDAGLTIGAIGTVKALNIGLQNTFARLREKDAIDAFAITTNITASNTQDDATKSSWKARMGFGNGNDNFIISRSGVGSTTFYDLLAVSTGSCVWYDGAGGTRMTLNSTGLGVGASPTQKFVCAGPRSYFAGGGAVYGIGIGFNTTRTAADHVFFLGATDSATPDLVFSGASGAELMRLNAVGNVGIGIAPSAGGSNYYKTLEIGKAGCGLFAATTPLSSSEFTYLSGNGVLAYNSGPEWKYGNNGAAAIYGIEDGVHKWYNATTGTAGVVFTPTQAMTLDSGGILVVGNTAAASVGVTGGWLASPNSGNSYELIGHNSGSASGSVYSYFFYNSSQIGSITQNGTTGVLYNTTSDYRLKESVQPIANGLARVNALKPSIYKWKVDGSNGEGFIAHELAEVVPFAVSGEKDAVNEDGSIKPQGVDLSKVVPILVAAIQELAARVQTLETR